jgi:hypothetical protein
MPSSERGAHVGGQDVSERAHIALGFEVIDRCANFRKTLGS